MQLNLLWLYNDVLNMNADIGNINAIKYRCKRRNIKIKIDTVSLGESIDMTKYDLIYSGTGQNRYINKISEDLQDKKQSIEDAVNLEKIFFLLGISFSLFGSSFEVEYDTDYHSLDILPYRSVIKKNGERCVGFINVEADLEGEKIDIVGFENHDIQVYDSLFPLGNVRLGNGNLYGGKTEGYMKDNFICTNIIGPVLPRNPEFSDFIIKKSLEKKYNTIILDVLDDSIEKKAQKEFEKSFK